MTTRGRSAFFFSLILLAAASVLGAEELYRVKPEAANFRSGPGISHKALGTLRQGDTLALLERSGEWLKMACRSGKLKGMEGWVAKSAVQFFREVGFRQLSFAGSLSFEASSLANV